MPMSPSDMSDAARTRRAIISEQNKAAAAKKADASVAKADKPKIAKRR